MLTVLLLLLPTAWASAAPLVELNINIIDDESRAIEGALVIGRFYEDQVINRKTLPGHKGITNKDGAVKLSGHEDLYVDLTVRKEGYYQSRKRVTVRAKKAVATNIILRKKRNPIAMYAKHFRGFIPGNGKKVGFDFSKGDFVHPYGEGVKQDIYFSYRGYFQDLFNYDGTLFVSFPGETDGLIDLTYDPGKDSEFKLPYKAPDTGYRKVKEFVRKRVGKGEGAAYKNNLNQAENFGYFLRIRSKTDVNGEITSANYVKIAGEIRFDPRVKNKEKAFIEFTYYLNPLPNDRNMEFSPHDNLFKRLNYQEYVDKP